MEMMNNRKSVIDINNENNFLDGIKTKSTNVNANNQLVTKTYKMIYQAN